MSTNFIPATCPSCSGDLQVPDNISSVKCMYCGNEVILNTSKSSSGGPDIKNLKQMAQQAAEAENYDEAYSYYNRALEIDPNDIDSLIGKGTAAGWSSTLANFRLKEMQVTFEKALANIPDDELKESRIEEAIISLGTISLAMCNVAVSHLQEFGIDVEYGAMDTISLNKQQESEWHSHIDQVMAALIYGINLSNEVGANDEIKGILYSNFFGVSGFVLNELTLSHPDFSVQKVFVKSNPGLTSVVGDVLDSILEDAKRINPELADPRVVAEENKSWCYIATEVFDDPSHRDVNALRQFRADVLYKFELGRLFCKWYEENGSKIAKQIGSNALICFFVKKVLGLFSWLFRHSPKLGVTTKK
jgi:hypothetical protein